MSFQKLQDGRGWVHYGLPLRLLHGCPESMQSVSSSQRLAYPYELSGYMWATPPTSDVDWLSMTHSRKPILGLESGRRSNPCRVKPYRGKCGTQSLIRQLPR